MLKGFKGICFGIVVIVQAIENVGRKVWFPTKWSEGQ